MFSSVSRKLLQYGRLVPLQPGTKKPSLRKVIEGASNSPSVLAQWDQTKAGCDVGIRLWGPSIIVLDFERPGKGSVHGGLHTLAELEAGHDPIPRTGPRATSENGGEHWFFSIPPALYGCFLNWSHVFPGIDIRVCKGLVVIPPSAGRRWIISFDDADLPELPVWFCDRILAGRTKKIKSESSPGSEPSSPPLPKEPVPPQYDSKWECAPVSKKESCRLFACRDFPPLWNRNASFLKDRTNNSYEFWIVKVAFRRGLKKPQILTVIDHWWKLHGIDGKKERLLRKTIPEAWKVIGAYVEDYEAKLEAKKAGKTTNRILEWIDQHGASSPSELEIGLDLSHSKVQKALIRLLGKGILERSGRGRYQRKMIRTENCQQQ